MGAADIFAPIVLIWTSYMDAVDYLETFCEHHEVEIAVRPWVHIIAISLFWRLVRWLKDRRKPKVAEDKEKPAEISVRHEFLRPKLHTSTAYILFFTMGWCGAHHFYLQKVVRGFFHTITGGYMGMGMFIDFFKMRSYVNDYNKKCHPDAPYCQDTRLGRLCGRVLPLVILFWGGLGLLVFKGPHIMQYTEIIDIPEFKQKNPYHILEVSSGASFDEITRSYRDLARQYHPDKNVNCGKPCQDKMADITEAYENIKRSHGRGKGDDAGMAGYFKNLVDEWELTLKYLSENYGTEATKKKNVEKEYMTRIKKIYKEHNLNKVDEVEALLKKHKGREHSLYIKVCEKYGIPRNERLDQYDGETGSAW